MTKVKFRIYDKRKKKMLHGDNDDISGWIINIDLNGCLEVIEPSGIVRDEEDFVKMQYTGLKDKNGEEIYEGDIIKWLIFPENKEPIYVVDSVSFGSGCYKTKKRLEILGLKEPHRRLEVIGNIYENNHLLTTERYEN